MGFHYNKRPVYSRGGLTTPGDIVQTSTGQAGNPAGVSGEVQVMAVQGPLAHTSTGTALTKSGLSVIVSTSTVGTNTWKLPLPGRKGIVKHIAAVAKSSDDIFVWVGPTSAATLYNTTLGQIKFSTGNATSNLKRASLISVSSAAWTLLAQSTGVTTVA